jgi:hypothetical protein
MTNMGLCFVCSNIFPIYNPTIPKENNMVPVASKIRTNKLGHPGANPLTKYSIIIIRPKIKDIEAVINPM